MTLIYSVLLAVGVASASAALTSAVRRYALKHRLLDQPNARSSHVVPTPRGGGLAIVLSFLVGALIWAMVDHRILPAVIAIGGAGLLVAAIGFWDDHGHVKVGIRLAGQAAAGLWVIFWLNGLPQVPLIPLAAGSFWVNLLVFMGCWLGFIWIVNLFNFMDGIDGIAAVEAASVALGGVVVGIISGLEADAMAILLAASVLGFLPWNWAPARIFMGDVGSGFIGAVLAGVILQAGTADVSLIVIWLILMGVFVTDATMTLLRRAVRGDRVYEAHRTHAYQNAARFFGSHRKVSTVVLLINCTWLIPLAIICALGWVNPVAGLMIAYVPLVLLCWKWRAGVPAVYPTAQV